jgi:hypothetical protein
VTRERASSSPRCVQTPIACIAAIRSHSGAEGHLACCALCCAAHAETLPPTPMPPGYGAGAGPLQQEDAPPSPSSASLPAGSAANDAAGGKGITLAGDELQAFLAQARQGGLAQAMGGQRGPPPEAAEEPGSEVPTHATADDPEFSKYWRSPAAGELALGKRQWPSVLRVIMLLVRSCTLGLVPFPDAHRAPGHPLLLPAARSLPSCCPARQAGRRQVPPPVVPVS